MGYEFFMSRSFGSCSGWRSNRGFLLSRMISALARHLVLTVFTFYLVASGKAVISHSRGSAAALASHTFGLRFSRLRRAECAQVTGCSRCGLRLYRLESLPFNAKGLSPRQPGHD
jgi:hypothetical protein